MRSLLILACFTLALAVEQPQTTTQLPEHIQNLITNHINHVLHHIKHKPQLANTLTGHVPTQSPATVVAEPYPDLLPPIADPFVVHPVAIDQPKVAHDPQVKVINHQATATLFQSGQPVVQNKVVMPPVPHVVVSVPGQQPVNIADKVHKLQQHVSYVMQQAQTHIPLALQQAIKDRKKQAERDRTSTTTTTEESVANPKKARSVDMSAQQVQAHVIPQLIGKHRKEIDLGKCNFECPREALTICASNGKCVVNFPGQCELSQWNCFNTKNVFHQVHDSECQNTIKCYQRDMM